MAKPLVSVIVLSYNRPLELAAALQSIEKQSYSQLEILVVDNESEHTEQILRVTADHPRMHVVRNRTNLGFAGGMNKGIGLAAGEYAFLTEDDIVLDSDCITHLVDYMERHPSVGLASGLMYNKETIQFGAPAEWSHSALSTRTKSSAPENLTPDSFVNLTKSITFPVPLSSLARMSYGRSGGFVTAFLCTSKTPICVSGHGGWDANFGGAGRQVQHWDPPDSVASREIEVHKFKIS